MKIQVENSFFKVNGIKFLFFMGLIFILVEIEAGEKDVVFSLYSVFV